MERGLDRCNRSAFNYMTPQLLQIPLSGRCAYNLEQALIIWETFTNSEPTPDDETEPGHPDTDIAIGLIPRVVRLAVSYFIRSQAFRDLRLYANQSSEPNHKSHKKSNAKERIVLPLMQHEIQPWTLFSCRDQLSRGGLGEAGRFWRILLGNSFGYNTFEDSQNVEQIIRDRAIQK